MSASQNQSGLGQAPAGTTFDQNTNSQSSGTPSTSVGSATAAGHGQHPADKGDDSNASLSSSKYGVQKEDLEGEQMAIYGEDQVINAQLDKRNAGWGEQDSLTGNLDRMKAEQKEKREEVKEQRQQGQSVDGGAGNRLDNEGLSSV